MLEFTTTRPASSLRMTIEGATLVAPPTPRDLTVIEAPGDREVSLYLHGDLQDAAGFDIAVPHAGTLPLPNEKNPTVVQDCRVWIESENAWREALMFAWLADGPFKRTLGLVVDRRDERSLAYAQDCLRKLRGVL